MDQPTFLTGQGRRPHPFHESLKSDGSIGFAICIFTPLDGGAKVSFGFGYSLVRLSYPLIRFSDSLVRLGYPLIGFDYLLAGVGNSLVIPFELNWKIYHRACEALD